MRKLFPGVVQPWVAHTERICTGEYKVSSAIIYRTGIELKPAIRSISRLVSVSCINNPGCGGLEKNGYFYQMLFQMRLKFFIIKKEILYATNE